MTYTHALCMQRCQSEEDGAPSSSQEAIWHLWSYQSVLGTYRDLNQRPFGSQAGSPTDWATAAINTLKTTEMMENSWFIVSLCECSVLLTSNCGKIRFYFRRFSIKCHATHKLVWLSVNRVNKSKTPIKPNMHRLADRALGVHYKACIATLTSAPSHLVLMIKTNCTGHNLVNFVIIFKKVGLNLAHDLSQLPSHLSSLFASPL